MHLLIDVLNIYLLFLLPNDLRLYHGLYLLEQRVNGVRYEHIPSSLDLPTNTQSTFVLFGSTM